MPDFWKKINKPITVLAPMDDVTDFAFREIIASIAKPDVLFTEFTSTDALCSKGFEKAKPRLAYSETQRHIVAQIWGSDPENFKKTAKLLKEWGFDGIDINMGCPDKSVMQKGCGAALVNKKELVEKLINATREGAPELPLSVKTRLDNSDELTKEWISFLLTQNINTLTLHARTAKELSKVPAHWEELGKAVKLRDKINPEITIIGNGDVQSYKEVLDKHHTYGVDGVMIGRGIFHNPWLFEKKEESDTHSTKEYLELLTEHTKLFNDTWGRTKNFETMKKFFKVYVKDFNGANEFRQQLMETKSYEEFYEVVKNKNVSQFTLPSL